MREGGRVRGIEVERKCARTGRRDRDWEDLRMGIEREGGRSVWVMATVMLCKYLCVCVARMPRDRRSESRHAGYLTWFLPSFCPIHSIYFHSFFCCLLNSFVTHLISSLLIFPLFFSTLFFSSPFLSSSIFSFQRAIDQRGRLLRRWEVHTCTHTLAFSFSLSFRSIHSTALISYYVMRIINCPISVFTLPSYFTSLFINLLFYLIHIYFILFYLHIFIFRVTVKKAGRV